MKYKLAVTNSYKKDLKLCAKRNLDISKMEKIVDTLLEGKPLAAKYKDHSLTGNWLGFRECHVTPNWLLVYKIDNDILILTLTRTGTHSDLFS